MLESSEWFYIKDGKTLKNLKDLFHEIKIGSESESFKFHMHNGNNDFANWLENVFNLKDIAKALRNGEMEDVMNLLEKEIKDEVEEKKVYREPTSEEQSVLKTDIERFTHSSEEKLERMNAIKKKIHNIGKDFPEQAEELEEMYKQIYDDISTARKEGVDVFIPSLRMKNIKSKIAYFKVSRRSSDFESIKDLLEIIRAELKECIDYVELNIKKEIMIAAETTKGEN